MEPLEPHSDSGQSPVAPHVTEIQSVHALRGRPSLRDVDDPQLASELAARNEEALAELYNRYGGLAYATAMRVLGDSATAEDVVQEAFFKLWNNATNFASTRGSLRGWLTAAVRNRAIDRLRGRSAHERDECALTPQLSATEPMSDPWRGVSVAQDQTAVRVALASLPDQQRLALELAYYGSYTQPEIAGMMGVTLGTIKGRMRLGLRKLSGRLQGRDLLNA